MRGWWLWLSSSKKHIKALHHKSTIKVVQISCAIFQVLWHMIAVCKEQTKIWVSLWKSCPPPIWTCFSDICNNLNLISEALSFLRWWFNMMFLCIKFTNHFSSLSYLLYLSSVLSAPVIPSPLLFSPGVSDKAYLWHHDRSEAAGVWGGGEAHRGGSDSGHPGALPRHCRPLLTHARKNTLSLQPQRHLQGT